jgi:hypothetical protein
MTETSQSQTNAGLEYASGFVLNPDRYYAPSYRISPFRTEDIALNLRFPDSRAAAENLTSRLAPKRWRFTSSGKEAIGLSLAALGLARNDCVTIFTTSANRYISGCVTREIEKFCQWSRKMEPCTAAILVNHEFGYPYRELASLKQFGVPIIEDACHSFLADTSQADMGRVGDFVLFSLPKVFPIQIGGVLAYDPRFPVGSSGHSQSGAENYQARVISHYVECLDEIRTARIANYNGLRDRFEVLGCHPRFELLENDVPGVFLFSTPPGADLPAMKEYGWNHGIECSVFYGEDAFFIPVHQRLGPADLDYFKTIFGRFLEGCK